MTSRELEVLRLLGAGLRNVDLAERLVLSPRTVEHHVSAILGKLKATTRAARRLAPRPASDRSKIGDAVAQHGSSHRSRGDGFRIRSRANDRR
jgi:DNA-binding transcriptional ArsR family regulator